MLEIVLSEQKKMQINCYKLPGVIFEKGAKEL